MRVLDNLENYDIPSGFHLTAEQEEQLAADLKEIVLALIPLRSSKLKTRQYFNSHLRYTSNVKYAQSRPDAPQDRYEFGDSYTPLPGEYTWNSDLLQPALLDILREDMYSFGFVVNYIDADLQGRGNDHRLCYRPITDGANAASMPCSKDSALPGLAGALRLNSSDCTQLGYPSEVRRTRQRSFFATAAMVSTSTAAASTQPC